MLAKATSKPGLVAATWLVVAAAPERANAHELAHAQSDVRSTSPEFQQDANPNQEVESSEPSWAPALSLHAVHPLGPTHGPSQLELSPASRQGLQIAGQALTGLGTLTGVMSWLSAIRAANLAAIHALEAPQGEAHQRIDGDSWAAEPSHDVLSEFTHAVRDADRAVGDLRDTGVNAQIARLRRLSSGLAIGSSILINTGGVLIFSGMLRAGFWRGRTFRTFFRPEWRRQSLRLVFTTEF